MIQTPFQLLSDQVARMSAELGRLQRRMNQLELVPDDRSAHLRAIAVAQDLAAIMATVQDPALLTTAKGRRAITAAMRAQGWTVGRIARALGVSERTIWRANNRTERQTPTASVADTQKP